MLRKTLEEMEADSREKLIVVFDKEVHCYVGDQKFR